MEPCRDTGRRRLLLGAASLVFAATAVIAVAGGGGEPPLVQVAAAPAPRELVWRAGDRRAYRLDLDSQVTLGADDAARELRCELRALLCLRVLEADGGRARVAVQLRDVAWRSAGRAEAARQAALGLPFLVAFDGAMPLSFEFPAGLDAEIRQQLAEVLRTFQATLPAPAALRWTAIEEHATGRYRAVYRSTSEGFRRRKAAYVRGALLADDALRSQREAAGVEASVRVLESEGLLRPAGSSSWWERATVSERIELSTEAGLAARVRTRALLVADDRAWDAGSELATVQRVERLLATPVPVLAPADESNLQQAADRGPASAEQRARFDELVAQFTAGRGSELGFVHELADMLRRHPELAAELLPVLAEPELPGTVAAGLAHALELAGNAECQQALDLVATTDAFDRSRRIQAIIALGGVEGATAESLRLLGTLGEGSAGARDELGRTALLALGRAGHTLRRAGAAEYAELAAGLRRTLERSADPQSLVVALKAVANTRDAALAEPASARLDDAEPAVRAAAAEALAAMERADALPLLAERLADEPDGRVRAALVDGMQRIGADDEAGLRACAAALPRERDPDARAAMARYLGEHLARFPQGRAPLERLLERESSPEILSYVAGRLHRSSARPR